MSAESPIRIAYFSDALCVWAYIAQIRLDELKLHFGPALALDYHFVPVFGSTARRIGEGWKDKGGFAGFGEHVRQVCRDHPHVEVHPELWLRTTPASSAQTHLFIKAVQLLEEQGVIPDTALTEFNGNTPLEEFVWRVRQAFFTEARDVSDFQELFAVAEDVYLPRAHLERLLGNGAAMAAICQDKELCERYHVEGSPTYILNEGRQKLYGNLGYRILEANVHEVIYRPQNQASWC